jgi:hypothetical protein
MQYNENRMIFARQSVNGRATVVDKVYISLKGDMVYMLELFRQCDIYFFSFYYKLWKKQLIYMVVVVFRN